MNTRRQDQVRRWWCPLALCGHACFFGIVAVLWSGCRKPETLPENASPPAATEAVIETLDPSNLENGLRFSVALEETGDDHWVIRMDWTNEGDRPFGIILHPLYEEKGPAKTVFPFHLLDDIQPITDGSTERLLHIFNREHEFDTWEFVGARERPPSHLFQRVAHYRGSDYTTTLAPGEVLTRHFRLDRIEPPEKPAPAKGTPMPLCFMFSQRSPMDLNKTGVFQKKYWQGKVFSNILYLTW